MPERERTHDIALKVVGVSKTFFETPVLRDADIEVRRGEVHCLVGGNGSGKSTLVKIIAGVHHADCGTIRGPSGTEHEARHVSSATAKSLGIHTVHQESSVFPALTVAENLVLGNSYPTRLGRIDRGAVERRASELLERFRIPATPDQKVGELSPAVQALIAIARALQDSDHASEGVLVLDEPTATMAESEVKLLLAAIRGYAADGQGIILVTHRLDEVLAVADRVTVLRDGEIITTVDCRDLDRASLAELIVGRELADESARAQQPFAAKPVVLEISQLSVGPIRGLDLQVKMGEIVGVAALLGGGGSELLERVFALRSSSSGTIAIQGEPAHGCTSRELIKRRVALIPQNRGRDASFAPLSVRENLTAGAVRQYWRAGRLSRKAERAESRELARQYGVLPPEPRAVMSGLSGGNQQKVVLARWLRRKPLLLLLDEPTQGVDVGARAEIHEQIRAAVDAGAAALLASTDLDELVRLSDRIVVLADGVVVADRPSDRIDRREIVTLMNSTSTSPTRPAV
jgi:ribose transport system ATP-binding protein